MTAMEATSRTTRPVFMRSAFLDRQKREREALSNICRNMPVGIEQRFMSASKVAESIGVAFSFLDSALRAYEKAGILFRRLEFGAKDDKGEYIPGRSFHWTLLVNKDEALVLLDQYHEREREAHSKPPAPKGSSLKARILAALTEHDEFETIKDLARAVGRNGENLDFHSLTHVMESLVKEGKITFDRGTSKDRIPYNIRLSKHGVKALANAPTKEPMPTVVVKVTKQEDIPPVEEPKPIPVVEIVHRVAEDAHEYPTIMRLIKRREWLEQAARLAESADEDDVAITLLDRAKKPLSSLETEAMALFEAYRKCRGL